MIFFISILLEKKAKKWASYIQQYTVLAFIEGARMTRAKFNAVKYQRTRVSSLFSLDKIEIR